MAIDGSSAEAAAAPAALAVNGLGKVFRAKDKSAGKPGIAAGVKRLFAPATRAVVAVEGLTFSVRQGERVAFVGPNGAGKSTTIKILAGVLAPTSGTARVLGLDPAVDRRRLAYRIGTVFGQRSQLWYHLPAKDSFALLARIYDLEPKDYEARLADLTRRFDLGGLTARPVRQLSLGERMRCEVVASLLHRPEVLFLDEPTIGLDVTAKAAIRDVVRAAAAEDGATVLLTSHDTGDIEGVCDRVLVIHEGKLLLDLPTSEVRRRVLRVKRLTVRTAAERVDVQVSGVDVVAREPHVTRLAFDPEVASVEAVIRAVLSQTELQDLTVEDPPMEEVVRRIYADARVASGSGGK